jgi:hypothetical protein
MSHLCAEHAALMEALGEETLTIVAALLDDERKIGPPIVP